MKKLVEGYGEDVERMAKDRKLNPEQRTVGELRRALARLYGKLRLVNDVQ